MTDAFEVVIGLEVHAELSTASKIFCGCATAFGAPANTQVCPVCLGLPGTLPVLNQEVLQRAIKTGLALDCRISARTKFDRKNYFYPDLPKAYQISQFDLPVALDGKLVIPAAEGAKTIRVKRVHMEEDAGKLVHVGGRGQIADAKGSLVDYNRAGVPLIEIVSEPDLRSGEEAHQYLSAIKSILRYCGISDCNMEEGSLRCDANISVRPWGQTELGVKTELKNMNSFKNVKAAIDYESRRQMKIITEGGRIIQETRLWDAEKSMSYAMRTKEEAHDYRYFPEPDLPPAEISPEWLEKIRRTLPELPQARKQRFQDVHGLNEYDAGVLTASRELADYFESSLAGRNFAKAACNWISVELLGKLNSDGREITASPVSASALGDLVAMIEAGEISGKIGKQVFAQMYATAEPAAAVVKQLGVAQITDPQAITRIVDEVLARQAGPVAEYRAGKTQAFGFLVGQAMKATAGQAEPKLVNQILKQRLEA